MNYDLNNLNETFAAHESLTPDAEAVLAKSHEIARNLKRRQWAVRATGGAVLGVGIVVSAIVVPGALSNGQSHVVIQPADSTAASPASGTTAATAGADAFAAFFNAGYTYADAQQLAQLWNLTGADAVGNAKAEGGADLLKGQTLPIPPSGTPASPDEIAQDAFFNAGYDYADAQKLGQIWNETDIAQIKVDAGKKLEAGDTLPVQPSGGDQVNVSAQGAKEAAAVDSFFSAGYTYDDAVQLAQTWNTDSYHAKIDGGEKLEAGQTLPIPPSGTPGKAGTALITTGPSADEQKALTAYFAAGYDYADAQQLAQVWHETDITKVKAEAGTKLENGETLPVAP